MLSTKAAATVRTACVLRRMLASHHHHHQHYPSAASPPSLRAFSSTGSTVTNHMNQRSLSSSSTDKTEYDNILVETIGNVGVIRLHRPKALNALSDGLFADLLHATQSYDRNDNIGCMVLTGSTPKAFAAGADITEMQLKTFAETYTSNLFQQWNTLSQLSKPILAAVNGYCLGGGCELAMMCDIVLASDTAQFGQPEINLGVIPGAGGTQRLTRAIGKSKAMHMALTGEFMSANDAERAGLVAKVYKSDELFDEAVKMATKIASKGRISVQMAKEAINASQEMSLQNGLNYERRLFHAAFATEDQKEGMKAFVEKRSPNFTNK